MSAVVARVRERLQRYNVETPFQKNAIPASNFEITSAFVKVMSQLGLDMEDDSLRDTPKRIAKMFCKEIFSGLDYANFPECTAVENKFAYRDALVLRDVKIQSMCEHHLMPIVGKAVIAYVPGKNVLGLSKFARIADFFSSRPQVQERLTMQIGHAIAAVCETEDVYVSIQAEHMCMNFRGVEDPCSNTTTFYRTGKFQEIVL